MNTFKIISGLFIFLLFCAGTYLFCNNKPFIAERLAVFKNTNFYQLNGSIDSMEFAIGHPNVSISAINQLKEFPEPRFKENHQLLPNVQWMAPNYFGGHAQPGISNKQMINNSVEIQKELALRWNYYLLLPGNTKGSPLQYSDSTTLAGAWINLANQYPELPASVILHWAQIKPTVAGFKSKIPYILKRDLPPNHYVKGTENLKGRKKLHPAAPLDSFRQDGLTQRFYLNKLLENLSRPIDLINENGEVFSPYSEKLLLNDSLAVREMKIKNFTDLKSYQAYGRSRIETSYRDAFMSLPQLKNTIYTEYGIDGHATYREKYSEVRKINQSIKGQYYPTPDFYPRWPKNWEKWTGAWHGIKWITDSRLNEIKLNDHLFSPFVAAGWSNNEEENIRPAQWLALMKALGTMGAEFYYTGFFNLKAPFAKPENYAWQAVVPVYAQGITSYYEELLRDGELLNAPVYRFKTENSNELVFVRKHKSKPLYIISSSIQVNSNFSDTPGEINTSISLEGKSIKFKTRRQGSTYVFDCSNPEKQIFYQLDGWHERSHPLRWNKEYLIEAELFETNKLNKEIVTETPTTSAVNDYSQFVSYILLKKDDAIHFTLQPAQNWPEENNIWIKARVTENSKGKVNINLNEKTLSEFIVEGNKWKWYQLNEKVNLISGQKSRIDLTISDGTIELDKVLVGKQKPDYY